MKFRLIRLIIGKNEKWEKTNYLSKAKIIRKSKSKKMKIKEIEKEVNYNIYYSNNKNKSDDISNDVDNIDNIIHLKL